MYYCFSCKNELDYSPYSPSNRFRNYFCKNKKCEIYNSCYCFEENKRTYFGTRIIIDGNMYGFRTGNMSSDICTELETVKEFLKLEVDFSQKISSVEDLKKIIRKIIKLQIYS